MGKPQYRSLSLAIADFISDFCSNRSPNQISSMLRFDYFSYAVFGLIFTVSLTAGGNSAPKPVATDNTKSAELIKTFEGFRSCPYLDPVGVPTIGFGNTYYKDRRKVTMSDPCIDRVTAKDLMLWSKSEFAEQVDRLVTVQLTQNQKTALTSFAYNVGIEGFKNSTLLKRLNAGDVDGAANEFDRWIHGDGGRVLPGLIDRRKREKELFRT